MRTPKDLIDENYKLRRIIEKLKLDIKELKDELYEHKRRAGKYCRECGELKPLSEFNKNKKEVDGYEGICRKCRHEIY